MANIDDDDSWQPPSESELKVIEARRERNNKISSLMGQYLLKGYKMLATSCPICDCVLLEDRGKNKYCVGCFEVDADARKDNPAVSEEAARRTVEEIQHRQVPNDNTRQTMTTTNGPTSTPPTPPTTFKQAASPSLPRKDATLNNMASSGSSHNTSTVSHINQNVFVHGVDITEEVGPAMVALRSKLIWCTAKLLDTENVHEAQSITALMTETCKAIEALRNL